jgi:YidC/Oxa1 family membrane protein insertase
MISFFANLFGYVLNFLYEFIGNYGLAIILFSVLVKIVMLPISIKQQKTMKKSQKINEEMRQIQFKYKNDTEKMNQEVMALYKREKLSPFSGCLSAIVQIILLFSVFYLVRQPLTYMKKVDPEVIGKLQEVVQENGKSSNYQEIAIINYINNLEAGNQEAVSQDGNNEQTEKSQEDNNEDNNSNEEKININNYRDQVYINMDFIGLDLSKVPLENLEDLKVLVIPALYVISSFISIRISTNATKKKKDKNLIGDGKEEQEEYDPMEQANKSMSLFMPFMSISIACIAPLGLALYWLVNNILMIAERLILNKFLKDDKEEAKTDA